MYIKKLIIKGFGRITGLTLEFKKELNVIYGVNESGKSTLHWFIRSMFFGIKGGRASKEGMQPPLRRFKPWEGSSFGGLMEYVLDGVEVYRVERDFKEGSSRLFDSQFNDITDTFSTGRMRALQFAEKQLGIDETCFEKTVLISQMSSRIDLGGREELFNRITNLSETGFEDVSFRKAEKALRNASVKYIGTEKTSKRPLDKINNRLDELKEEENRLKTKRAKLLSVEKRLIEAGEEKSCLYSRKSLLLEIKKLINIKKQIETSRDTMKKIERVSGEVCNKKGSLKEESSLMAKEQEAVKRNRGFNIAMTGAIIMTVFLTVAGFITGVGKVIEKSAEKFHIFGVTVSAIFLTGAVVCLFIAAAIGVLKGRYMKKNNNKPVSNERALLIEDEVNKMFENIKSMEQNLNIYVQKLIDKSEKEYIEYDNDELINMIQNLKTDLTWEDIMRMEEMCQYDFDRTETAINDVALKIKECQVLLEGSPDSEEIQKIKEEIGELEWKKTNLEEIRCSLEIATEVLSEAASEIRKDFLPRLNASMGRFIKRITKGRYKDLRFDSSMNLNAIMSETEKVGKAVELSSGTIDQMYLALRVAAVELIEGKEGSLPLIMDEAFAQYDDERTIEAFKYLKSISKSRQIIFFTCKRREVEIAQKIFGDSMNFIELSCQEGSM